MSLSNFENIPIAVFLFLFELILLITLISISIFLSCVKEVFVEIFNVSMDVFLKVD